MECDYPDLIKISKEKHDKRKTVIENVNKNPRLLSCNFLYGNTNENAS